jgi:hypothetical protein
VTFPEAAVCYADSVESRDELYDAVVDCRDRQLDNTQRALASAQAQIAHCRVLLIRTRDALDLALAATPPEDGA